MSGHIQIRKEELVLLIAALRRASDDELALAQAYTSFGKPMKGPEHSNALKLSAKFRKLRSKLIHQQEKNFNVASRKKHGLRASLN